MKRFFRSIFALIAVCGVACTNSGEEGGLSGGDNGGNGGNTPPPAVTFTIEVSDKTPINAEVSVTPSDKTITYFCDAVLKVEFERFATAKACARKVISDLKTVCESQGYTLADVLSTGAGSRRFIGFVPETEYYILAFGVDTYGTITTEVFTEPFTTLAEVVDAEMTFDLTVLEITSNSAYVAVTPSNSVAMRKLMPRKLLRVSKSITTSKESALRGICLPVLMDTSSRKAQHHLCLIPTIAPLHSA